MRPVLTRAVGVRWVLVTGLNGKVRVQAQAQVEAPRAL